MSSFPNQLLFNSTPRAKLRILDTLSVNGGEIKHTNHSPYNKDRYVTNRTSPHKSPMKFDISNVQTHNGTTGSRGGTPIKSRHFNYSDKILDAPNLIDAPPNKIIDFSDDEKMVVALGSSVYLWKDGEVDTLLDAQSQIDSLCWVGNFVAVSSTGNIEIWDPDLSTVIACLPSHEGRCGALASIGNRISTGGSDGIINITDVKTKRTDRILGHTSEIISMSWSLDGVYLASADIEGQLFVWGGQKKKIFQIDEQISSITWMGSSFIVIACQDEDGTIYVLNPNTDSIVKRFQTSSPVSCIRWSEDIGFYVSHRGGPFEWDVYSKDFVKIQSFPGHSSDIIAITITKTGKTIATLGNDETIRLWEISEKNASRSCSPFKYTSPFSTSLR